MIFIVNLFFADSGSSLRKIVCELAQQDVLKHLFVYSLSPIWLRKGAKCTLKSRSKALKKNDLFAIINISLSPVKRFDKFKRLAKRRGIIGFVKTSDYRSQKWKEKTVLP